MVRQVKFLRVKVPERSATWQVNGIARFGALGGLRLTGADPGWKRKYRMRVDCCQQRVNPISLCFHGNDRGYQEVLGWFHGLP